MRHFGRTLILAFLLFVPQLLFATGWTAIRRSQTVEDLNSQRHRHRAERILEQACSTQLAEGRFPEACFEKRIEQAHRSCGERELDRYSMEEVEHYLGLRHINGTCRQNLERALEILKYRSSAVGPELE